MSNPQIKRPRDGRIVTASEIHSVAFCPESYRLKRSGARLAAHAKTDAARGTRKHDAVNERVAAAHARDQSRWCFVATHLYGIDDPRTDALRAWRDRALMSSRYGRALVRIYYTLSPPLVSLARRAPILDRPIRAVVDRIVSRVQKQPGGDA